MGSTSIGVSRLATVLLCAGLGTPALGGSIDLGKAGDYAIFAMEGATLQINSMTLLEGDIGLGANVGGSDNKKTTQIGTVYRHNSSSATFNSDNYDVSGGIVHGTLDAMLEQATIDALAASISAAGYSGSSLGTVSDSLDLIGSGGLNVFTIDELDYNADSLNLHGTASDFFVFNVLGDFNFAKSEITLDGIDAAQVLFNFPGASGEIKIYKAESVVHGTFLSPFRDFEYHNPATFEGAIIGGGIINLHSDANLKFAGAVSVVPVPPAALLGFASMAGLGLARLARRR